MCRLNKRAKQYNKIIQIITYKNYNFDTAYLFYIILQLRGLVGHLNHQINVAMEMEEMALDSDLEYPFC